MKETSSICNICNETDYVYVAEDKFPLKKGYQSFCPGCGRKLKVPKIQGRIMHEYIDKDELL